MGRKSMGPWIGTSVLACCQFRTGGSTNTLDSTYLLGDNPYGTETFVCSPDSTRVIYLNDSDEPENYELFSIPIAGGISTRLNAGLAVDGDVQSFEVSHDSTSVFYLADRTTTGILELFSVPIAGGQSVRLNKDLVPGASVWPFSQGPDGKYLLYGAEQVDGGRGTFRLSLDGGEIVNIGPDLEVGDYIASFDVARVLTSYSGSFDLLANRNIMFHCWQTDSPP